ncbi:MAG: Gfo/Idh/MocA family oxidoreductase, partial [Bacteroidetes bacterium]|nr:Gfo/Idh/MocA family oxidoreductase [Bacteroidota bacterium]
MSDQLKTALVGVGKVTDMHARALVNLKESLFTAVCGRNREKTENYAARYGIRAYTDVAEMVAKEQIDVVIICTPHPNHREPTIAALEAGANVLIEKPLASSLEDCDAMIEASDKCGKQIGV